MHRVARDAAIVIVNDASVPHAVVTLFIVAVALGHRVVAAAPRALLRGRVCAVGS